MKIIVIIRKYKSIILYGFFGVLTTIINIVAYYLCFQLLKIANVPSTIIAWILAVLFAFFTNKVWVFESKSFDKKTLKQELIAFLASRTSTGLLDVAVMYYSVDVMRWNSMLWKAISNLLVIILNYILSKLVVFKKR